VALYSDGKKPIIPEWVFISFFQLSCTGESGCLPPPSGLLASVPLCKEL
jgi:hypothetical protein